MVVVVVWVERGVELVRVLVEGEWMERQEKWENKRKEG